MDNNLLVRLAGLRRTIGPVAPVTAAVFDTTQLRAGDVFRAMVLARLADGTYRVSIDSATARLALPGDFQPGDSVELRAVARRGTLRLEVMEPPHGAEARVSGAGRLVAALLRDAPHAAPAQTNAIVDAATGEPAQLAGPLERAVERSGLFYESHQARWVKGDYPLELLREEPQARQSRAPQTPDAAVPRAPNTPPGSTGHPETASVADETSYPTSNNPAGAAVAPARAEERQTELVARDMLPLVRQQLEALESRQLVWLGEIWPGQPLKWEIADQGHSGEPGGDAPAWTTRLALQLPGLGDVGAELKLSSRGLLVGLSAASDATHASLTQGIPDLASRLRDAGIDVLHIKVEHRAPAD